jgi:ABC-2 type transport system ATP-binding protein
MSIKVEGVSKLYGTQKALNNVSFEVEKGEVAGFLGPNGAGKSTMMKILTCYIPPSSGNAYINGMSVLEDTIEIRKKIGYLPELNPLYTEMYVKEYLQYAGSVYRIKNLDKRIKDLIDMVGLEVEQHKKIEQLSKGYRQRVGLLQAMIHDPEVLILDEPTTGLDPNQLTEIRNLIKKIGKEKTVLLSTHIMQEVEAMCNKVIIINKGEIVADGEWQNISNNDRKQLTVLVEFNKEISVEKIKQIAGVIQVNKIGISKYDITANGKQDIRPMVNQLARDEKAEILAMNSSEKKLEDIFKELTR